MPKPQYIATSQADEIACLSRKGSSPGVIWLGGFKSTMDGNKARALDMWASRRGRAYLRFDYFGHGLSTGDFREGTITRWRDDALAVLDRLSEGSQVLVGSSMGAWIALLVASMRRERVAGLLFIAPAIDFTEILIWDRLSLAARLQIHETGEWLRESIYDAVPYPITRSLIEDGRKHLLLAGSRIAVEAPLRILQGMKDPDVPWQHAVRLLEAIDGDAELTLVSGGDHRLSTPGDLRLLERTLDALVADIGGA